MKRTAALALLATALLTPLLPLVVWAIGGRWRYPALVPQELSGRGLRLLADPSSEVVRGLVTSASIGAAVTVLGLLVGVPAGWALGMHDFRGKRLVQMMLLAPAIVPSLAVLLGTQVIFLRLGLADSAWGVVLVQLVPTVPYVTLVMASAFAGYDTGYEDQARLLGASRARAVLSVTLPALRPSVTVAAVFAFLISWSEYVLTLLIGGGTVKTLPLLLFAYARSTDLTEASAVALLLVLPPLLGIIAVARGPVGGHGVVGLSRL